MRMTTSRSNSAKITGPAGSISLGDLRWLVEQLEYGTDDLTVSVMTDQGFNQMDSGSTTLSAQVPDRKPRGRPIKDSPQA